jgi:hypothetical protein
MNGTCSFYLPTSSYLFSVFFVVSRAVSRRCAKCTIQLASDTWLDI